MNRQRIRIGKKIQRAAPNNMAIIYANCLTQFCSSVVVATAYVVVVVAVVAWGVWAVAACELLLLPLPLAKKRRKKQQI